MPRAFTSVYDHISVDNGNKICVIWFKTSLSDDGINKLNTIVANHTGDSTNPSMLVKLDIPSEADGRPNFVSNPVPLWWRTWFCGAGDDPVPDPTGMTSGRGTGAPMLLQMSKPGTDSIVVGFTEPVLIHDGKIDWGPPEAWGPIDFFDVSAIIPPTPITISPDGTGNCNLVPLMDDTIHLIVPNPYGTGTHVVDLATACPFSMLGGGWNADQDTGAVSASTPETADESEFGLADYPLQLYFMRHITMGSRFGTMAINVYKTEWLHPSWQLVFTVHKTTLAPGWVSAWMLCFRKNIL